ncbi:MAG: polyphosphate kinase 1, partial [Victivallales bacterium]|nr:polyphosphate kinase 1 [Victivallales bacterium]
SNLDEFFMVRVAGLRQQTTAGRKLTCPAGMTPHEQLSAIRERVLGLFNRQIHLTSELLDPLQDETGMELISYSDLNERDRTAADIFFKKRIFPVLTPVAVDPSHPFPILKNGALEIAVSLKRKNSKKVKALVEVPSVLPRMIQMSEINPGTKHPHARLLLEELISNRLEELFKGAKIVETLQFRIIRDMDFDVDDDLVADLLEHIESELRCRMRRDIIRHEIEASAEFSLRKWILRELRVADEFIYSLPKPLNLTFFMDFLGSEWSQSHTEKRWPVTQAPVIRSDESIFLAVKREKFISLFHPFQPFSHIVELLDEAADDPTVLSIKQTLYRVSGDSPVVSSLLKAARNGKQVTVVVELKARFDEERNIVWAKRLEDAGAHVIYGIPGLKIHCKALLVTRSEEKLITRYLHLSTGNYNDSTAKLYTDVGYLTNDSDYCADAAEFFNVITGYSEFQEFRRLAAAPFNLRQTFISLIDREARLAKRKAHGAIIAKMNSLVDPEIIEALYKAARQGVKIDLIVRGICCLNPALFPDRINVVSIIDRYLEHTRVYYFRNGGAEEYYLSSADWMPRNLDRRIELIFPVDDPVATKRLLDILRFQLEDTAKSHRLVGEGCYERPPLKSRNSRSQERTSLYFQQMAPPAGRKLVG